MLSHEKYKIWLLHPLFLSIYEYQKLLMFDEMLESSYFKTLNVVMIVSKYEIVLEYSLGLCL